jgi:recombination protein RecA
MSNEARERIIKEIEKQYGDGIAIGGQNLLDDPSMIIPLCPSLNVALSGGIPEGSWVTLAGKPKCGKTTTALHFAAKCQRPEYGSRHVYYLNIEGRLKRMNLQGILGLKSDPDNFTLITSTREKILSAQDFLTIGEKILLSHDSCLLIVDSYSSLCHEKEITEGIGTSTRGGGAMLLAQFCRQMSNVVPIKKSIVVGITHLMANTSGYGSPYTEKGGFGIAYQVDVKLKVKSVEPWKAGGKEGKQIGQKVNWICETSALGPPGMEAESCLRYGHGIDEVMELIQFGKDMGFISVAGAGWSTLDFMKENLIMLGATEWNDETKKKCRAQGDDKLYTLLQANPSWMKTLEKQILAVITGG